MISESERQVQTLVPYSCVTKMEMTFDVNPKNIFSDSHETPKSAVTVYVQLNCPHGSLAVDRKITHVMHFLNILSSHTGSRLKQRNVTVCNPKDYIDTERMAVILTYNLPLLLPLVDNAPRMYDPGYERKYKESRTGNFTFLSTYLANTDSATIRRIFFFFCLIS